MDDNLKTKRFHCEIFIMHGQDIYLCCIQGRERLLYLVVCVWLNT